MARFKSWLSKRLFSLQVFSLSINLHRLVSRGDGWLWNPRQVGECLAVKERKRRLGVTSGGNRTSTTHSSAPFCPVAECVKKERKVVSDEKTGKPWWLPLVDVHNEKTHLCYISSWAAERTLVNTLNSPVTTSNWTPAVIPKLCKKHFCWGKNKQTLI